MEILKVEYLSNHWLDFFLKFLTEALGIELKSHAWKEDDQQWKKTPKY